MLYIVLRQGNQNPRSEPDRSGSSWETLAATAAKATAARRRRREGRGRRTCKASCSPRSWTMALACPRGCSSAWWCPSAWPPIPPPDRLSYAPAPPSPQAEVAVPTRGEANLSAAAGGLVVRLGRMARVLERRAREVERGEEERGERVGVRRGLGSLQKIWACMTNTICHVKSKNCHIKQLMAKITCHAGRHITTIT